MPPERPHYVALGSSFAAGPGIPPLISKGALRSGSNYPHLVANALGLRLTDVTCSGATTAHVLDTSQRTPFGTFAPQIEFVTGNAALVTVTIGGNDLGYVGGMSKASVFGATLGRLGLSPQPIAIPDEKRIESLRASMGQIVEQIKDRAPQARVMLVDYLSLVGPATQPGTDRLNSAQLDALSTVASVLAETTKLVARTKGAELIAASAHSVDHALGSKDPWVTGLKFGNPWTGGLVPFHPNARGMREVAKLIEAAYR